MVKKRKKTKNQENDGISKPYLGPVNLKILLGLSSIVENLASIKKSKAIHIICAIRHSLLGSSVLLTLQILKWGITGNFNIRKLSQHFAFPLASCISNHPKVKHSLFTVPFLFHSQSLFQQHPHPKSVQVTINEVHLEENQLLLTDFFLVAKNNH